MSTTAILWARCSYTSSNRFSSASLVGSSNLGVVSPAPSTFAVSEASANSSMWRIFAKANNTSYNLPLLCTRTEYFIVSAPSLIGYRINETEIWSSSGRGSCRKENGSNLALSYRHDRHVSRLLYCPVNNATIIDISRLR